MVQRWASSKEKCLDSVIGNTLISKINILGSNPSRDAKFMARWHSGLQNHSSGFESLVGRQIKYSRKNNLCHLNVKLPRYIYMHSENIMMASMLMQIRELLERNLDAYEIAHRLHIDISIVEQVIAILAN